MLDLRTTARYRKERNLAARRGKDLRLLDTVIETLRAEQPLTPKHHDHALIGDFAGFRECHIENDWLLLYTVDKGDLILTASRTGSHSDVFG